MRLSLIREKRPGRTTGSGRPRVPVPRSACDADRLFDRAIRAMDAHRDGEAFRLFRSLARFKGEPGLTRAAETCRDVLDPDKSPDEKAERLARFFQPTLIHIDFDKQAPVERSVGPGFEGNGHDRERAERLDVVDLAFADLLGS